MDMEIKQVDYSSHKLYFDTILRDLASFSPEVRAERLRKFMLMMQKKMQAHNTADEADKPHRSDKSAAIGHTHVEDRADAGDARQDGASGATAARSCTMREDTKTKCEALRAYGIRYIQDQIAAGNISARHITARHVCKAYAASVGQEENQLNWMFRANNLDFESLKRAAVAGDASMQSR